MGTRRAAAGADPPSSSSVATRPGPGRRASLQPYEIAQSRSPWERCYALNTADRWGLEPHLVLIEMSKCN